MTTWTNQNSIVLTNGSCIGYQAGIWDTPYKRDNDSFYLDADSFTLKSFPSLSFTVTGGVTVDSGKKYLIVQRGSNTVQATKDTEPEAIAEAKRLASKHEEEYYIFAPAKTVRPIPIEVEVEDS